MNTSVFWQRMPLLLLLPLAAISPFSVAQDTDTEALPECRSVSYDPDGDGYGWDIFTGTSCRVTGNTTPAPEVIHRETGQPVLFERGFWDANADLVNRNLHCRTFEWSAADSQYLSTTEDWYWFRALPEQPPWISEYYSGPELIAQDTLDSRIPIQWSVVFGLFTSRSREEIYRVEFPASGDWIERFTSNDGHAGVRFWHSFFSSLIDTEFTECIDASGAPFGPTGHWDQPATILPSIYSDTPLYFTGAVEPYPNITNRETGQAVQFETGTWEFQADISRRTVECTNIIWDESAGVYRQVQYNPGFNDRVHFHPLLANSPTNESHAWLVYDFRRYVEKWEIDGANFSSPSGLANSMWYEPIERESLGEVIKGVRYWGSHGAGPDVRNRSYSDCYASERPPRGIYSFDAGRSVVIDFQPNQEAPQPDIESTTTDDNIDQNTPDSEQIDNNNGDQNTAGSESADTSGSTLATYSDITSGSQNEGNSTTGGGGFSLLFLWLAVFRNRLYRSN